MKRLFSYPVVILIYVLLNHQNTYSQDVQRINTKAYFPYNISRHVDKQQYENGKRKDNQSNNALLNSSQKKQKYVPGELIINYKMAPSISEIKGIKILDEYKILENIISEVSGSKVKECKPVFSFITNKMVEQNLSEREAKNELFSSAKEKQSSFRKQSLAASQMTIQLINNTELARTIVVSFEDYSIEPELLKEKFLNNPKLISSGYIVNYVEPNYINYCNYSVNDPYYYQQWSLTNTQTDLGWDIERGRSDILIGILDSGIDLLHEDLAPNIKADFGYDFVDIDTNAYKSIDYLTLIGEDYTIPDNNPNDFNGHGTHCAGIASAKGNNGIGICGVSQNCSLVPIRAGFSIMISGTEHGALEDDDIANGIIYSISKGIDVLSMSFGSSAPSETIRNAVELASKNGIILVAAAGNDNIDQESYPAAYNGVISVAATDWDDKKAFFSNYGMWVDVAAPGVSILSTVPKKGGAISDPSGYRYLNGTSMAAPFMAGTIALLLSHNPALTFEQIDYILMKSSDIPKEELTYIGYGRTNIYKALSLGAIKSANIISEITDPVYNELITSDVNILGNSGGSNYSLSYGIGLYPVDWIEINNGSGISNGVLGTLAIKDLPDGIYTIKLKTWDSEHEKEARLVLRISNMRGVHTGWPVKLNITTGSENRWGRATIADLDNDSKKEIIVLSGSHLDHVNSWNSSIYVYDPDGNMVDGWPVELPLKALYNQSIAVADIDNDGNNEIIVSGISGLDQYFPLSIICVFKKDGTMLKGWPQFVNTPESFCDISTSDINLDGKLEIVMGTREASDQFPNCKHYGELHVFRNDGTYLTGWPIKMPDGYFPRSNPVLANIDDDPELEVIVTVFYILSPNSGDHYTYAYNIDGSVVSGFPYKQNYWGWPLAAADLNNDGKIEIMTQKGPINNKAEKLTWADEDTEIFSSNIAIGDVNNDNNLELLYGNYNGNLFLKNRNGQSLSGWPVREKDYFADFHNIISDIAGDDNPDILINWVSYKNFKTGLFAYNSNGTVVNGFPKFSGIFNFNEIMVDDIDNDGLVEIFGMDYSNVTLMVLDMDKTFNKEKYEWPMYQNNPWNSGLYTNFKHNVLTRFNEFSIKEDSSLAVQISPYYLNWRGINLIYQSDTSAVKLKFSNGLLKVIPEKNWNGNTIINLIASNGSTGDTTSFKLKVLPVNDAPSSFSLIEPKNKQEIFLADHSASDTLLFKWNKASDVENDTVFYKFTLRDSLHCYEYAVLKDTSVSVPFSKLSSIWGDQQNSTQKLFWNVRAFDKKDSTLDSGNNFNLVLNHGITGIKDNIIPKEFALYQNYPNPFNPLTTIRYDIPLGTNVLIKIYDIIGSEVTTLVNEFKNPGNYEIKYDAGKMASGIYFYKIQAGSFTKTNKLILLK